MFFKRKDKEKDDPSRNTDGYVNSTTGVGTRRDSSTHYAYEPEGIITDQECLIQYDEDGLFAKIIDSPAEESMRPGYDFENVDEETKDYLFNSLTYLDWTDKCIDSVKWSRLTGGSLAVMIIDDGREIEEPLDYLSIKRIDEILVFDRTLVVPDYSSMYAHSGNAELFLSKGKSKFGQPEFYTVNSQYGSFRVHESRCLVFKNGKVPEKSFMGQYRYWGIPELARIRKQLQDSATSATYAVGLLQRMVQAVYKMNRVTELIETDDGTNLLLNRVNDIGLRQSYNNIIAIDAQGEDFIFQTASMAGVNDVIESTNNMLSAVSSIPQTVLFGRSPAGMSATGESDLEIYHTLIERIRRTQIMPNFEKLVDIIMVAAANRGLFEEVPEYSIVLTPLKVVSEQDQAAIDLQKATIAQINAQTSQVLSDLGAVDPSEVRKTLAKEGKWEIDTMLDELTDDDLLAMPEGVAKEEENQQNPLQSGMDSGTMNADEDVWRTTENGSKILIGEGGEIKGGLGGKFTGQKASEAFGKKKSTSPISKSEPTPHVAPPKSPAPKTTAGKPAEASKASPTTKSPEAKFAAPQGASDEPGEPFDIGKVPKKDINQIENGRSRYIASPESFYINQAFWTGDEANLTKDRKKTVEALDRNMRPIGEPATLYRYIDEQDPIFKAKPGQTITNKGYSSTSSEGHAFSRRAGKVEIRVPPESKVYIPKDRSENETILHRDASFKIVSRKVRNGKVDIIAELIE